MSDHKLSLEWSLTVGFCPRAQTLALQCTHHNLINIATEKCCSIAFISQEWLHLIFHQLLLCS